MVLDDEDERLWLKRNGRFEAEVVPEREVEDGDAGEGAWRRLSSPDDMVEFYDPTDLFGDLAEALAESFPPSSAKPARTTPRTRTNPSESRPGPERAVA